MYAKESPFIAYLTRKLSDLRTRVCTLTCQSMRLRVYTSISRVCCAICMIVRARSRPEMEVRDSWNDLEVRRFSLFSFRMGRPIFFFFFFTFYLASLAFRPIPTCFRTPIQSLIVHTHSLILSFSLSRRSFSRNPLVTFNANCVAAYSNCHVNLVKSEWSIQVTLTRARGDVPFRAEIYAVVRNERVSRKFH